MSTTFERPPERAEATTTLPADGGLEPSATITLGELSPGARLVLRCRKDWRAASVASIQPEGVRLNVASPTGHTYRVRRPHDAVLTFCGAIPILADCDTANWRVALARYDARW